MASKEEVIKKVLEGSARFEDTKIEDNVFEDPSEIADLDKITTTAANWETPFKTDPETSWDNILKKTETHTIRPERNYWMPIAATISLLMVIGFFLFYTDSSVSYETGYGEIATVNLPDGSEVTLNARSKIELEGDWREDRVVKLTGKARFEVEPGEEKFVVISGGIKTTVLGTSFDVNNHSGVVEVSCYTGKVEVSGSNTVMQLKAGERVAGDANGLTKSNFNARESGKWIHGEFIFDNVRLDQVVYELERQFNLQIAGYESDSRLYKGYFYKDDVNEALKLVFEPMGYRYKVEGSRVTIE